MSIEETSVIDFVSIDPETGVILSVSDHLEWNSEVEHLRLLQEQINTYCQYVENGQLYDEYPQTRAKRPRISIVFFPQPPARCEAFLQRVKTLLANEGFDFEWKQYRGS